MRQILIVACLACIPALAQSKLFCAGADAGIVNEYDFFGAGVSTCSRTGTHAKVTIGNSDGGGTAGVGACSAGQYESADNSFAAPTCAQVQFSQVGGTASLTTQVTGVLPEANGGTGVGGVTCAANERLTSNGTVFSCQTVTSGFHNILSATHDATTLDPSPGDLLYRNSGALWTNLAAGTGSQLLHSGSPPSWGAVGLDSQVTGVLPVGNGGTGISSPADDTLLVGTSVVGVGNTWVATSLPTCGVGQGLAYVNGSNSFVCAGAVTLPQPGNLSRPLNSLLFPCNAVRRNNCR